jgi:ribosomal-protein-alanine N-acetyltransferase
MPENIAANQGGNALPLITSFPEIETDRLVLRQLRDSDAPVLYAYFTDPEVIHFYDWVPGDESDCFGFVQFANSGLTGSGAVRWGITQKETDEVIGTCGLQDFRGTLADLGFELKRECWGKGIMTEAATAVVNYGFTGLGCHRIEAWCFAGNDASARVLQKLGFSEEGTLREAKYNACQKAWADARMFGLLNREWVERSSTEGRLD